MVVCPCGVMVPAAGVGRARRGPRPPSCFDTSTTVTTQPKDIEEPASVDKLTAASNEHTGISIHFSWANKNKGTTGKPCCDDKSEHSSRTTLALATTESGRYVGTRPLRSNRSPTPTLHKIPLRTTTDQKNTTSSGRPSKHLPAVRTSPTSPQDKQAVNKATQNSNRVRGPIALPRHNVVNHRINDMNASNQRRLLKQNLSPEETQLRSTTRATPPATKTFPTHHHPDPMTPPHSCVYENLPYTWHTPEQIIYENLRPHRESDASGGLAREAVVTESQMDPSTGPATPEPPCDSHETTVWLSDSWKYNTIKRAPDFNIFEFPNIDSGEENERGNRCEQQTRQVKDKRKFRSKLPTFGRKKDKENKSKEESKMNTPPGYGRRGKDDNQKVRNTAEGRDSTVGIHKGKTSRPPLAQTVVNGEGARSKDPSPHSSDSESKASRGSARYSKQAPRRGERDQSLLSRWSGSESSVSSDSSSCVSPLISPSLSLRSYQLKRRDGGSPLMSPTLPRRQIYSKTREGGSQLSIDLLTRDSSPEMRNSGSLEMVTHLAEQGEEEECYGRRPGRPSRHAHLHQPTGNPGDGRRPGRAAPYPTGPEPRGQRSPQVEGTLSPPAQLTQTRPQATRPRQTQPQGLGIHPTGSQDTRAQQEALPQPGRPGVETSQPSYQCQGLPQLPAPCAASQHSTGIPRPAASPAPRRHLSTVASTQEAPFQAPSAAHKPDTHRQIPSVTHKPDTLQQIPTATHKPDTLQQIPTAAHTQDIPQQMTKAGQKQGLPLRVLKDGHRQETPRQTPTAGDTPETPRQTPNSGHKQGVPSRIPKGGHKQETLRQAPTAAHRQVIPSKIPAAGLKQDPPTKKPTSNSEQQTPQQIPNVGPTQETCSQLSNIKLKQEKNSHLPTTGSKQEARSQLPNVPPERQTCSRMQTLACKQEISSQVPTIGPQRETCPQVPTTDRRQEIRLQGLTVDPTEEKLTQVPNVVSEQESCSEVVNAGSNQDTRQQLPDACPELRLRSRLSSTDDRQETSEVGSRGQVLSRCSAGTRNSSTSPTLPPLPQELLDERRTNSPEDTGGGNVTSTESSTDYTSVCILSLDLTVDCEEFSENGFSVVNIKEHDQCNLDLTENETEKEECKSKQNTLSCSPDKDSLGSVEFPARNSGCGSSSLSASSSSVRFDEKYYEKDDYDFPEERAGDQSEEREDTLDLGIPSMLQYRSDDALHKVMNDTKATIDDDDDDDFIDIDCDVKPMETLKRPLVYGYGRSPIRTFRRPSTMEKRLSQASDISDYMEMRLMQSILGRDYNAGFQQSESCIDFHETYWDHWQAKKSAEESHRNRNRNSEDTLSNRLSKFHKCPSSKFCYDPEVLLAQVKCPKSLEDATFKQYSACVKSHICDRSGNVYEDLKEYGLTHGQPDWISSQPELPDLPKEYRESDMSSMDYSSEPELSNTRKRRQPRPMPAQCHPQRVHPSTLSNKRDSLDSGTWTYLPNSEESTVAPSPLTYHPEPLPRSASSLSHFRAGLFNPWHHLLPDVTPPRTPRHSVYYNTAAELGLSSPSVSRPASPTPSHRSFTSRTPEPHTPPDKKRKPTSVAPSPPRTPTKRSFLPSLSMVIRSPLKRQNLKSTKGDVRKAAGVDKISTPVKQGQDRPAPHESIKNRRLTTISSNSSSSSKSSSSSSSGSSGSSKDSVKTVIAAPPRSKGAMWLMKHFGSKSSMAAV